MLKRLSNSPVTFMHTSKILEVSSETVYSALSSSTVTTTGRKGGHIVTKLKISYSHS